MIRSFRKGNPEKKIFKKHPKAVNKKTVILHLKDNGSFACDLNDTTADAFTRRGTFHRLWCK